MGLTGRINRAAYWLFLAMLIAILVVVNMLSSQPMRITEGLLFLICIPRMHDIGRSGWWLLAPLALEVGGAIAIVLYLPPETAEVAMGLISLAIVGLLIWLGAVPGETEANRFGDPPAPGLQFKPSTPAQ
jgi:uncharacterized membrane protein YhaH (DUF805 family)